MNNVEFIGFDELPSTNSYALSNIEDLNDRGVIFAKTQNAGHGRLNRNWVSYNPKNLYCSIILKPADKINNNLPLANLTQYMSVVLCETLEEHGVEAQIKWPNDVLVGDKKIAGILAESSTLGINLRGVVLGVGVNLNSTVEEVNSIDQPATSLNLEIRKLGIVIDQEEFMKKLVEKFFHRYDIFLMEGFDLIKTDYVKRCSFIGKQLKISDFRGVYPAIAKDVNSDGTLRIEKDNEQKDIRIGDILC